MNLHQVGGELLVPPSHNRSAFACYRINAIRITAVRDHVQRRQRVQHQSAFFLTHHLALRSRGDGRRSSDRNWTLREICDGSKWINDPLTGVGQGCLRLKGRKYQVLMPEAVNHCIPFHRSGLGARETPRDLMLAVVGSDVAVGTCEVHVIIRSRKNLRPCALSFSLMRPKFHSTRRFLVVWTECTCSS